MERESAYVVKIGGGVINDPDAFSEFLREFASMPCRKILVHGGGRLLEQLASRLGVQQKVIGGRRITDRETLGLATMVYAGRIAKSTVAILQQHGCNALSLSGADMNVVRTTKRTGAAYDFGFVGDVTSSGVNVPALAALLDMGVTPVMNAITHDGEGQLLNTNADSLANCLACALSARFDVTLHYCFEKSGVLRDVDDESSVIAKIDRDSYRQLLQDNVITAGMLPKLETAFHAISAGVDTVMIGSAKKFSTAIYDGEYKGTRITA